MKSGHASRWAIGAAVTCALILHIALTLRVYPLRVLKSGDVPLVGDVGRYFATANASAQVHGIGGYDPYFMAGYPVGLWDSMGRKGFEVFHYLFPGVPLPTLFYLVLVGTAFAAPLILWLALRKAMAAPCESSALFLLTLILWHLSTQVGYFWSFGNVFFPATSCLVVAAVIAAERLCGGLRPWVWAFVLGILGAAVFYFHTVLLVAAAFPLGCLLLRGGSGVRRPACWGWLAAAAAVFLALAVWWLVPLLQSREICEPAPKAWFRST